MTSRRTCLTATFCTLATACLVLAAPPAATSKPAGPARPAAEPALKLIPAGTMGYAILNNLKTATDDADKFLKQVGLADLLKDELPGGVLKELLKKADLGDGFNPNGSVAVALLDPSAFGVDLIKMMKSAMPGASASAPASGPAAQPPLPVVIFLPGTGVKEVLGRFNPVAADPYMKITVGGMDLFVAPLGSYILVSPNAKALEAVAKAPRKADDELKGRHAQVVRGSAVAIRLNVKAAYPVIEKASKALDLLMSAKDEGLVDSVPDAVEIYKSIKPMMGAYLFQMSQMDELTVGLRLAETGVVVDAALSYLPDTTYGKATAAFKAAETPLMDSVIGESYVMAVTSSASGNADEQEIAAKGMEALLANPALPKIPAAQHDKIQKLHKAFLNEITGVAFVMNGAPADAKGILSFSLVLKGHDSAKIKALLAEGTDLVGDVVKALAADNKDLESFKLSYDKDVEKVDGVSADSITLKTPLLDEGVASMLFTPLLGETGIAPLVAAPNKETVVITFGGGVDTLSRAIKAALGKDKKDQRILAQKETAEAMKYMPRNTEVLMFFNVGNYFDVIMAGMKKMGGGESLPFAFTCKTPIALGVGTEGASQVFSFYVPTDVVKEIVGFFSAMRGGMGGGGQPAKPVPGGEEF
jgi:hypothetical protein